MSEKKTKKKVMKKNVPAITNEEKKLLNLIKRKNLSPDEAGILIKGLKSGRRDKYGELKINFPDKRLRFGAFSDAHMGHKCYRGDALRKMVEDGKRQDIEFWINTGDTVEGMSGREGHIYELAHLGASEQLNFFEKEFALFDRPVYAIEAQDSHGGWFHSKGNAGLNIGEELERRSEHYHFLGYDEFDLILDNGLKIRLRHPGGGTAYALSYKAQKYISSISGGKKPHLLFTGHFHKALYMFYRNIHSIDAGCLCDQTPFMRKIGTPAHVGYWIVDVNMHKRKNAGIERVTVQFVPFFE